MDNAIPQGQHIETHEANPGEGNKGWIRESHPGYKQLECSRRSHFYLLAKGTSNPGGWCGDPHCGERGEVTAAYG